MGIAKDIERLFKIILDRHDGNKAAAASSLNVNPVTFWGWAKGKRKPPKALCDAIDMAGGKLLLPGEESLAPINQSQEIEFLRKEISALSQTNAALKQANSALVQANAALSKVIEMSGADAQAPKTDVTPQPHTFSSDNEQPSDNGG